MANRAKISEQLRQAILAADVSRYRIAKETKISEALLCRFIKGDSGLGQASVDKIGEQLGLQLVKIEKPKNVRPKTNETRK